MYDEPLTNIRKYDFVDFIVSGMPLWDIEGIYGHTGFWQGYEYCATIRSQLLLEAPNQFGGIGVPLYVCPACGDEECGFISVSVHRDGDTVIWSNFRSTSPAYNLGKSVGYDWNDPAYWHQWEVLPIGPFHFQWQQYHKKLMSLEDLIPLKSA